MPYSHTVSIGVQYQLPFRSVVEVSLGSCEILILCSAPSAVPPKTLRIGGVATIFDRLKAFHSIEHSPESR
jgi:hypothetical protein